jgi:hypothetical protein
LAIDCARFHYCYWLSNSFESDQLSKILIITTTASEASSNNVGTRIVLRMSAATKKSNDINKPLNIRDTLSQIRLGRCCSSFFFKLERDKIAMEKDLNKNYIKRMSSLVICFIRKN